MQSDPIGIVPSLGVPLSLPEMFVTGLQEFSIQEVVRKGLTYTYVYVESNPFLLIDPYGLYGTRDCSYYTRRCEEVGGVYHCYLAPFVCKRTPPGKWSNCVRQCLQEFDYGYCNPCQRDTIWSSIFIKCAGKNVLVEGRQ